MSSRREQHGQRIDDAAFWTQSPRVSERCVTLIATMKVRGRLGRARTERNLVDGVVIDAIPFLQRGYRLYSSQERSIIGDAPKILFPFHRTFPTATHMSPRHRVVKALASA